MSRNIPILAVVCLVFAVPALAGDVELTPTIGYRWGGDFDHLSLNGVPADISVDDGEEFGLIVTLPVSSRIDLEFRWSHQGTDLTPGLDAVDAPTEMSADTYLGGLVYKFPVKSEVVKPFLNVELGSTQFDVNNDFSGDAGFAFAVGGGSKFYFGDHFGVRVQGSYLSGNIPGGQDVFCKGDLCYTGTSRNSVGQFELTTGFVFKF